MPDLGKQIQGRILGPSGTDVLSQGMKDLYHFLLREEKNKPRAPFGGVPSISQMPRTQERSGLDIGRSYWAGLSQEEKLMEFVDLLAPGPAKLGAGVKAVLGAAKGVPLVAGILRKDALKQLGRQFRHWVGRTEVGPSKTKIKELIQGIRKAPQKELDFVGDIGTNIDPEGFGSFTPKGKKYFPREPGEKVMRTEEIPSLATFSLDPRLPSGEGVNTVFHELGHARIAGSPVLRKVVPGGKVEEGIVRRFGDAIAPFAEQAVREGKKLNPAVVPKMLRASVEESRQFAMLGQTGFHSPPKLDEARKTLRGQLPGEMRMFLEESSKKLSGEDIAKKIGGIRYEGVMEGLPEAGIPNVYQFTAMEGVSKSGTFSSGSLDLEDVRKALGKQEETWRRVEG